MQSDDEDLEPTQQEMGLTPPKRPKEKDDGTFKGVTPPKRPKPPEDTNEGGSSLDLTEM